MTYTLEDFTAEQMQDHAFRLAYQTQLVAEYIGRQIVSQRQCNGLSQRDLAAMVGTGQGTISRWESGSAPPTIASLVAVSDCLDCDIVIELKERAT